MSHPCNLTVRALTIAGVAALTLSCSPTPTSMTQTTSATSAPRFGAWGVDLAGMDPSVAPGDDFYRYVNGRWHDQAVIPADKQTASPLSELQQQAYAELKALVEGYADDPGAPPGSEPQQIRDWYLAMMDETTLAARGLAPLAEELARIDGLTDRQGLADLLADNLAGLGATPLAVNFEFDRSRINQPLAAIATGGLAVTAREVYLDAAYAPVRQRYLEHLTQLFQLIGRTAPEQRAARVLALETEIARFSWPLAEKRDPRKRFNPTPVTDLSALLPGIDWSRFLARAGVGDATTVDVTTRSSIAGMAQLIANAPLAQWRDYLTYHLLYNVQAALPQPHRAVFFSFYGKTLGGQPQADPRWLQVIADMGASGRPLVDPLGKAFVERYVPPASRPQLRAIVANLLTAFDNRLRQLGWMTPQTRQGARDKLAKTTIKVVYPDLWQSARGLEVSRDDAIGNLRRAAVFMRQRELGYFKAMPDRRVFLKPVYQVNAYANPAWNEVVFLAAIVRPPFFDPAADSAVNYGALGAVIGHEISHLFDDQGRLSDSDGLLRDWWTPADAAQFIAVTDRLAAQIGSYEPLPGKPINGRLTLGESIADVAGLTVAFDAYQLSLKGQPAPLRDGFSGEQRFFLAYAHMWRWKPREAYLDQLLKIDVHPPTHFRPQTVRNIDAWYRAFEVKPGEALYLPPGERVNPW